VSEQVFSYQHAHVVLLPRLKRRDLLHNLTTQAFSGPNVWLIFDSDRTVSMDNVYFPIDSHVFTFGEAQVSGITVIYEVYKVSPNSPTREMQYGNWSKNEDREKRLQISETPFYERRKDLQGHVFHGQTKDFPPFAKIQTTTLPNKTVTRIQGILGDIWHGVLEKELNFTTQFTTPPDGQWGAPVGDRQGSHYVSHVGPSSNWTGIIGALVNNTVDVGVTGFYFTAMRGEVVRFSPGLAESINR
jgi:hypothetical protein